MKVKTVIQGCLGIMFLITGIIVALFMDIGVKRIVKDKVGDVFIQLTQRNGESIENKLYRYQKAVNSIVIDRFIDNSLIEYEHMTALERVDTEIAINQSIRPLLIVEEGIRSVGYWMNDGQVKVFGEELIGSGDNEITYSLFFRRYHEQHYQKPFSSPDLYAKWQYGLNKDYNRIFLTQAMVDYNTNKVIGVIFMVVDTRELCKNILKSGTDNDESYFLLNDSHNFLMDEDQDKIGTKYKDDLLDKMVESEGLIESKGNLTAYYRFQNDYIIVGSFSKATIEKEVVELRTYILVIILLCLLVVLFIAFIVGKYIDERFSYLQKLITRLEKGDFSMSLKKIESPTNEFDNIFNHFFGMASKVEKLIEENYISELDKREAELNALQYQINPHFLFNTLEIISSMARINKQQDIEVISKNLGQLFRYNMNRDNKSIITVGKELNHIKNYIFIQNMHYNQTIDVYYDVDKKHLHNVAMRFLMQPIIENCLCHGLRDQQGGMIEIMSYEQGECLIIDISDDGKGIAEEDILMLNHNIQIVDKRNHEYVVGLGLRNVNRRLKLVFGEAYGLKISSEGIGTTVSIILPLGEM